MERYNALPLSVAIWSISFRKRCETWSFLATYSVTNWINHFRALNVHCAKTIKWQESATLPSLLYQKPSEEKFVQGQSRGQKRGRQRSKALSSLPMHFCFLRSRKPIFCSNDSRTSNASKLQITYYCRHTAKIQKFFHFSDFQRLLIIPLSTVLEALNLPFGMFFENQNDKNYFQFSHCTRHKSSGGASTFQKCPFSLISISQSREYY